MKSLFTITISFASLAIIFSCRHIRSATTPPVYGGSEMLFQYKWNLTELNGKPVPTGTPDTAQLLFYPGQVSRVSGSTGCNRLNGTFELSGVNKIKFSPLATTKMACPGNTEAQFLTALAQVDNWSIINNELLLNNGRILAVKLHNNVSADQSK